ncbi:hypothetical protein TNCT_629661 [Trichonephila clavata]|uniref:Uncharacterized protein n=1 Tax=Trichonephila clavata TaxID=2740835 RepID=A0A8X6I1J2_TRICU|nr:hypothetical protein TNCT_629661 [Trichonephila clavata]
MSDSLQHTDLPLFNRKHFRASCCFQNGACLSLFCSHLLPRERESDCFPPEDSLLSRQSEGHHTVIYDKNESAFESFSSYIDIRAQREDNRH